MHANFRIEYMDSFKLCFYFKVYWSYIVHKVWFNLLSLLFYHCQYSTRKVQSLHSCIKFHIDISIPISFLYRTWYRFIYVYDPKFLLKVHFYLWKKKQIYSKNISPLIAKYKHCFHYNLSFINLLQSFLVTWWLLSKKTQSVLKSLAATDILQGVSSLGV